MWKNQSELKGLLKVGDSFTKQYLNVFIRSSDFQINFEQHNCLIVLCCEVRVFI